MSKQNKITSFFSKSFGGFSASTSTSNSNQLSEAIAEVEEANSDVEPELELRLTESDEEKQEKPLKRRKETHQKPGGGRSKFQSQYAVKYAKEYIEASSKGVDQFFCKACDSHLQMRKQGEGAIKEHIEKSKHKQKVVEINKSHSITQFGKIRTKQALPLPNLVKSFNALKQKLHLAIHDSFFGEESQQLLENLEQNGAKGIRKKLEKAFKQFCADSLEYLNKWSVHLDEVAETISDWILLENRPSTEKIMAAYRRFCGTNPEELDNLFGEIAELHETLDTLKGTAFESKNCEQKWIVLLKNANFVCLKKLISFILSIFPSNAYCESVFSIVKNTRTDERNRMSVKLLNSLVSIKCNSDFNCSQAYDIFLSNQELLDKVKSDKKYEE